jgi:hypothetical protein
MTALIRFLLYYIVINLHPGSPQVKREARKAFFEEGLAWRSGISMA